MIKPISSIGNGINSNVFGVPSKGLTTDVDGALLAHIIKPLNSYDEMLTYKRISVIQNNFTYGVNDDLLKKQEISGGTITWNVDGVATLTSTNDPLSKAILTSKKFIRSQADEIVDIYISAIFDNPIVGLIQEIGLGDATDGVFFCQDENGMYVFTRSNSVNTIYRQVDWNVDVVDGTGRSRFNLDVLMMNTYRIEFVNNCCFAFFIKNDKTPEWILVHKITVSNSMTALPLRIPSNFVCVVSRNTGASTGGTLKVSNFSVFNSGGININGILRSQFSLKTISTSVPVLSLKNKTTFLTLSNKITAFMDFLSLASDGTKNLTATLILNGTLVGDSFVDFDANNSPMQYDTSSTSISGGRILLTLTLARVDSSLTNLLDYDITINPGETLTVVAESQSNNDLLTSMGFRCNV